ncbi:hypothetical protein OUZ56_030816 [Daphnia magna]|uniref:Uncharacterized protein n=1 Tax=Daphnia magna TaxID=35525 RepID=A0ABQ9ZSE7_9CRUS|nr:hypothetical protein OUZ56_030816 [Daphnia magna]
MRGLIVASQGHRKNNFASCYVHTNKNRLAKINDIASRPREIPNTQSSVESPTACCEYRKHFAESPLLSLNNKPYSRSSISNKTFTLFLKDSYTAARHCISTE